MDKKLTERSTLGINYSHYGKPLISKEYAIFLVLFCSHLMSNSHFQSHLPLGKGYIVTYCFTGIIRPLCSDPESPCTSACSRNHGDLAQCLRPAMGRPKGKSVYSANSEVCWKAWKGSCSCFWGFHISSMSEYCLFYIWIETFCFSHKAEDILKDRLVVVPKFPFLSLSPQWLTLLLNLPDCPLPGTALFERVLKSLEPQQGGNEWALFSQKSFAASCDECKGWSAHSGFPPAAGQWQGDCVPAH